MRRLTTDVANQSPSSREDVVDLGLGSRPTQAEANSPHTDLGGDLHGGEDR